LKNKCLECGGLFEPKSKKGSVLWFKYTTTENICDACQRNLKIYAEYGRQLPAFDMDPWKGPGIRSDIAFKVGCGSIAVALLFIVVKIIIDWLLE